MRAPDPKRGAYRPRRSKFPKRPKISVTEWLRTLKPSESYKPPGSVDAKQR